MRAIIMTALLAACLCAPGSAEDTYDIKVYPAARAYERIALDGVMDEPSWQRAPLVGGFTHYNKPELVDPQTFFRVVYSASHLYFGLTIDEPQMKKIVPVAQARDAHAVFSGETIEFFVDPKHSHSDYYQFAVNAAGSLYDSRKSEPYWNADIAAATKLQDDKWTMEFAIPWKDLGVEPTPGALLGFNVCRDRQVVNERQWSNWSQTAANFHDPERFGHMVLSPTAQQLGQLGAELRKGDRSGPLVIFSKEGFSQTTYRSLARRSVERLLVLLAQLEQTRAEEKDATTRDELSKLIARHRAEVSPYYAAIDGRAEMDAAEWTRMDLRVNKLVVDLGDAVWAARLNALLSIL